MVESRRVLFSVADYQILLWSHSYSVRPDDQHLLMLKRFDSLPNELVLVLNFFEELKQRVGSGND